jgi:NAD(P)-dependent dehydrogenase (short-subunit alcohol dehydrogenase family)
VVVREVRVNRVAPGSTWTALVVGDASHASHEKHASKHGKVTPVQCPGQLEDVAPVFVAFASSAASSDITGGVAASGW